MHSQEFRVRLQNRQGGRKYASFVSSSRMMRIENVVAQFCEIDDRVFTVR